MNSQSSDHDARSVSSRASQVALAVVLVTAVSGYFMGLNQTTANRLEAREAARSASTWVATKAVGSDEASVPVIVEYRRLGEGSLKPNLRWRSRLPSLRAPALPAEASSATSAVVGLVPSASDAERAWAMETRAARRAFDGAPPVIPHPVDAVSSANCRACHLTGLAVRGLVAPKMSHNEMGNCTQCHVPAGGPGLISSPELAPTTEGNDFEGLRSAGRGSRAWPGAPPTIPHTLWMRQDCSSCHGPTGLAGLRTPHPERALCQQCHVPDGVADTPPWLRPELAGPVAGSALNAPP